MMLSKFNQLADTAPGVKIEHRIVLSKCVI